MFPITHFEPGNKVKLVYSDLCRSLIGKTFIVSADIGEAWDIESNCIRQFKPPGADFMPKWENSFLFEVEDMENEDISHLFDNITDKFNSS